MPLIGTTNVVSVSALLGLTTLIIAVCAGGDGTEAGRKGGHCDGAAAVGSQGQLCCGENVMLTVQLCCGPSEKGDPGEVAQLSCSVKLGRPLKSLTGKLTLPELSRNVNARPLSVAPAGSVFVTVMLCVVGVVPSI
jgi:hypothetical protein